MKFDQQKQDLINEIKSTLPDFSDAIEESIITKKIVLHQDSFAADYQSYEYELLGKAIKYAGIFGVEVYIIGTNRETLNEK